MKFDYELFTMKKNDYDDHDVSGLKTNSSKFSCYKMFDLLLFVVELLIIGKLEIEAQFTVENIVAQILSAVKNSNFVDSHFEFLQNES